MIAIIFYSINYITNKKLFYCKKNTRIRKKNVDKNNIFILYNFFIIFLAINLLSYN